MSFRAASIFLAGAIIAQLAMAVTGQITLASVSEGPCIHVKPLTMEQLDFDWALHFTVEAGYVPMASKVHYVFTTIMLTGAAPKLWTDLDKMCPKIESGLFDSTMTGYGKKVDMSCEIQAVGVVDCFRKNDPTRTNSSVIITWSDNQKYMVSVSCLPGNLRSWNVISTQTSVDEVSKQKIFKHLKAYGFNPENSAFPSYASC